MSSAAGAAVAAVAAGAAAAGAAAASFPDRRWLCMRCDAENPDMAVAFNAGCQSCGCEELSVRRLGAGRSSGSVSSAVLRQPSAEVAQLLDVSRVIARRALNAAGGDINMACRNLLINSLNPVGDMPFVQVAESAPEDDIVAFGGVSRADARALLAKHDGDVDKCKQELIQSILDEEELWDAEGRPLGPSRPLVERNRAPFECPICYVDAPPGDAIVLRICGHTFCLRCLSSHVATKMESGTNLISCPLHPSCKKEVCQNDLRAIVGVDTFTTLERRALESVVATDPSLHHCPTPDCPYIVSWASPADGPPMCDCSVCGKASCLVCGVAPYHRGLSCEQHKMANTSQTASEREAEERATAAFIERSNIRICKRCGNGVVKSSGCNKLKCRCGYRFCYVCGSENAQCGHTPSSHGFIDNLTGRGDFSNLRDERSPGEAKSSNNSGNSRSRK
jgi:hypothetical protein